MRVHPLFCNRNEVSYYKKRSAGMRIATYNEDVASDRRRRENVPRHILCFVIGLVGFIMPYGNSILDTFFTVLLKLGIVLPCGIDIAVA